MAGISLAQAEAKLALWLAAEETLATSQSYTITTDGSSRTLTRADLVEVGKRVTYWNNMVANLSSRSAGRSRTRYLVN